MPKLNIEKEIEKQLIAWRRFNRFLNDFWFWKKPVDMKMSPKIERIRRRRRQDKWLTPTEMLT